MDLITINAKGWSKHGKKKTRKRFKSNTYQLIVEADHMAIAPIKERSTQTVTIHQGDDKIVLGDQMLTIHYSNDVSCNRPTAEREAVFDALLLCFPMYWRKWREGDYFFPLGMTHRKKLSDFFIDKKISLMDKDRATVIESEGAIVWVVGHRIDNRYRITDHTSRVAKFSLSDHFD